MMKRSTLPVYEVEFLPVERRLTERRANAFGISQLKDSERRLQERRQPPQALRSVQ
jgi:hypothetical protein